MSSTGRISALLFLAFLSFSLAPAAPPAAAARVKVKVGYFPNLTHAQALLGQSTGRFKEAMGPEVSLEWVRFNAGPSVIEAIFAEQIDLAYIGPNPSLSGFVRSDGKALRVVAGSADGGAGLVARKGTGIRGVKDLAGHRVASPQLGNTQDIALRYALQQSGLASREKGGTVWVVPMANPDIRLLFLKKELDAAWVPEPWLSLLVQEADGELVLDERTLWPDGRFITTNVIASTRFLSAHRDLAKRFIAAHAALTGWMTDHPEEAKKQVNEQLRVETGKAMEPALLDAAWGRIRFSADPLPAAMEEGAKRAFDLGFLGEKRPNLRNLYDLTLLKESR
jgi:NitT/TauT family transport system substrate-binding protein